jgi:TPR repeat protein
MAGSSTTRIWPLNLSECDLRPRLEDDQRILKMDRLQKQVLSGCVLVFALASQVMAGALSDAERAYATGNYAQAAKLYRPLAQGGDAKAQLSLGVIYYLGKGVPRDYKAAAAWLLLAAKQGRAQAQNLLGAIYDQGLGVSQDYKQAAKWYRLAAEQGDADGEYNLGIMYARELGVPQDYVRAHMWMSLSGKYPDELAFVARQMSDDQIARARELARKCVIEKFQGC